MVHSKRILFQIMSTSECELFQLFLWCDVADNSLSVNYYHKSIFLDEMDMQILRQSFIHGKLPANLI